ncbi:hypothetical protein ABPG72_015036 [Tetrahymena utriculariae]
MNPNYPSIKVKQLAQQKKFIQRQDSFSSQINEDSQQSNKSFRSKDPVLENTPIHLNILHKDKHTKLSINNVEVYFPHKPYDVQVIYMESVIKCLQERTHGLLESPTGTGKTLSMLCACLGWLQQRREQQQGIKDIVPNRIIYCSRTHSQIQQVVKEIKTTAYQPKIIVQGSREQYCIKKEFQQLKGGLLNTSCQKAISQLNPQTYCRYFKGTMDESRDFFKLRMPDIEDLRSDGYNNNYCPFYHTQKVNNAVDVLFLPYNYLLDRNVMNQANINIKNAVIIFDEAHNIHKSAEEGYSLFLNYSSLCAAEADLLNLLKYIENGYVDEQNNSASLAPLGTAKRGTPIKEMSEFDTKNFTSCTFDCKAMIGPIQELRNYFKQMALKQIRENQQNQYNEYNCDNIQIQNGKDIFELIQIHTRTSKEAVNENSIDKYMKAVEKQQGTQFVSFENGLNQSNLIQYIDKANKAIKDLSIGASHHGLETWVKFLEGLKDLWTSHNEFNLKTKKPDNPSQLCQTSDVMQDYKLYFDLEDPENPQLNLTCLNPSLNFKKILQQDPHCLLFTSGTLKPFNFWKTELQIPFNIILENKHVIDSKKQLFSAVIKGRPSKSSLMTTYKQTFNFSYEKRKDQDMILDLGNALAELFEIIPNGVLIVFPSNQLMNQCKSQWSNFFSNQNVNNQQQKIYNRLLSKKFIYWEGKTNTETMSAMQDFKQKSKTQKGSAFFCVARGKITEGIDFSDESARAVILIGLPYPPLKNINIQVKKDYLNQQSKLNSQRINGNEWYVQEAIRAMNQSIGRVIRHINDWGSIIFLDERFGQQDILKHMPAWCLTQQIDSFDQALNQLSQFFNEKKMASKQKQEEQRRQIYLKKKEHLESEQVEQSSFNNTQKSQTGIQLVQKRAFDFTSVKSLQSQIQKPQKLFKQNTLVSKDQESQKSQQFIEKLAQHIKKNPFCQSSDDEENQPEQQFQIVKSNPLIKQENNQNTVTSQFDFTKPIKIKSSQDKIKISNSSSNLNQQQNVMSTKNSIYSNKLFFES